MPANSHLRATIKRRMDAADAKRAAATPAENRRHTRRDNDDRARRRAADSARVDEKLEIKRAYDKNELGQLAYARLRAKARSKGKFVLPDERDRAHALNQLLRKIRAEKREDKVARAARAAHPAVAHPAAAHPGDDDGDDVIKSFGKMSMGGNRTRRKRGRSTRAKHPR